MARKEILREEGNVGKTFVQNTDALEEALGHIFSDRTLLKTALTHSTYAHEMKQRRREEYPCNERLEFLGDAVLSLLVGRYLYDRYADEAEGELTNLRK